MAQLNLQRIKTELVHGGVARKYVKRTLSELESHYTDLQSQALADGLSAAEAAERASIAIGDEETILDEILKKEELKSLLWRYPKSVCLLAPAFILVLSIIAFGILLFSMEKWVPGIYELGLKRGRTYFLYFLV